MKKKTMQCCTKDKVEREAVEKSAKTTQPETHHICPSKLSKRELEDVYFAIMQSNLDLKRIINDQGEKQKSLTTKLQRLMNTQKAYMGTDTKECCMATKALVQEQKAYILELKRINDNLREQVKQLNMKLCSTKQFLKSPAVGAFNVQTTRPQASSAKNSTGKKNSSSSALISMKQSVADELKNNLTSDSCQYIIDLSVQPTRTVATATDSIEFPSKMCDENKCHALMDELKREIVVLHEALETDQGKYSTHVHCLVQEVYELQSKNVEMNNFKAKQEQSLNRTINENKQIKQRLSEAQNRYDELETRLKIERAKVAELETQLRATDMANKTIKTVESKIIKDANKRREHSPEPTIYYEKYKYLLDKKEPENIKKMEVSRNAPPTFKNKATVSPKLPRKIKETINASTLPAKIRKADNYSTSPIGIKRTEDSLKSPLIKKGIVASSKLPRKIQEMPSDSTSPAKTQKFVDSSTSPTRINKTEDSFKSRFIKGERLPSPKLPWKRQETAKASALTGRIQKPVDSSTSPIIIKNTEDCFKSPISKREKNISKLPQKMQETPTTATPPAKIKKMVDSSISPIIIKNTDDFRKSPLNKKIDSSTFARKIHTPTSPIEIRNPVDSWASSKQNEQIQKFQTSPSNIKETENIATLPQENQENIYIVASPPTEIRKYLDSSTSPTKIDRIEDSQNLQLNEKETVGVPTLSQETEDTSTSPIIRKKSEESYKLSLYIGETADSPILSMKLEEIVDISTPPVETQKYIESSTSPTIIEKMKDSYSVPSNVNETGNSSTLPQNIQVIDDISALPVEIQKTVDSSTSPMKIDRMKDSYTSQSNVKKTVDSFTLPQKTDDFSAPPVEMRETVDSSTSSKKIEEMKDSYTSSLSIRETANSPISSMKPQDKLEGSGLPKETSKFDEFSASPTKTDKMQDSLTNLLKIQKEFESLTSSPKSTPNKENILYEANDYNSTTEPTSPKISSYSTYKNPPEVMDMTQNSGVLSKSDQKHPEAKKTDDNKIPEQTQESFQSCKCCECPPMKIVRRSPNKIYVDTKNTTKQDKLKDDSNKPLDNSQIVSNVQNVTETPYKDDSKHSGDNYIDISMDTKDSERNTPDKKTQDNDIILNLLSEENAPFKSPYNEKAPSPQKLDDSGFADGIKSVNLNNEEKEVLDANKQLLEKIANLQSQLESLKLSIPARSEDSGTKNTDQFGAPNAVTPEAQNLTGELTPRKSHARLKYTAKRNEMDLKNKKRPDERFLTSEYNERHSPTIGNKSILLNDRVGLGIRKPSLTNQPQFIPTKQELIDQDQDISSQRSIPSTPIPGTSRDGSIRIPELEIYNDIIDKRVNLKLEPELYENNKLRSVCSNCDLQVNCETACKKLEYDCSEECKSKKNMHRESKIRRNIDGDKRHQIPDPQPVSSGITSKHRDSLIIRQDKDDDSPRYTKNAFALDRYFYEPPDTPQQKFQTSGSLPVSSKPTSTPRGLNTQQTNKDDDFPGHRKTSFPPEQNFYEAPKNPQQDDRNEKTLQIMDSTPKKYTKDDLVQNAQELEKIRDLTPVGSNIPNTSLPLNNDSLHGAQRTPDIMGGQDHRADVNFPKNGLEMNKNVKETPTYLKAADLKDEYAKGNLTCNQNSKQCVIGMKYQGLMPNDCSCPTDAKTGQCSCAQYTKSNAADVFLGEQSPEVLMDQQTTNLQATNPVRRRKVHAPLTVTGMSNILATTNDAANASTKTFEPFNANLNSTEPFKASQYGDKPRTIDESVDSKSFMGDEVRSPPVARLRGKPENQNRFNEEVDLEASSARGKRNDGNESLMSEKSVSPNYLQLKRPEKPKTQTASPSGLSSEPLTSIAATETKNLEPVNITMNKGVGELQAQTAGDTSNSMNKNQETFTIDASANARPENENPKKHIGVSHIDASPENTDREISSMSDLPSEKTTSSSRRDNQNRGQKPSGKDKCTETVAGGRTITRSTTPMSTTTPISASTPISTTTPISAAPPISGATPLSTATPFSLSEGEVPHTDTKKAKLSPETVSKPANTQTPQILPDFPIAPDSTTAKVEEALKAISQELARCHQLIQQTPPQKGNASQQLSAEKYTNDTQSYSNDPKDSNILLHAVSGRSHIGGTQSPRVIFTLHIGTMVLSDEAVINYRDLKLVLTWKFYDQNVAMSHMRLGRVVHFDFSTEYDLKLTDDFLNYLKTEELTIHVCEVNKLDSPLAFCSLPLREALLHTNRRADMSLALVNGPHTQRPPPDDIDARDEMGILDLWCMLRADVHILPQINKTIAVSRSAMTNTNNKLSTISRVQSDSGPIMPQINEDDQDEARISEDLESLSPINRLPKRDVLNETLFDRGEENPFHSVKPDGMRFDDYQSIRNSSERLRNFDTSYPIYPPVLDQSVPPELSDAKRASILTNITSNVSGNLRNSSGMLINDVPPNIRTASEMKHALENRFIPDLKPRKVSMKAERLSGRIKENNLDDILNKAFDENTLRQSQMRQKILPTSDRQDRLSFNKTNNAGTNRRLSQMTELDQKYETVSKILGSKKKNTEAFKRVQMRENLSNSADAYSDPFEHLRNQTIDITILWLALNEECKAMNDPNVQRLYVAYTFLGRGGAELETPMSLPKPRQYQDKCYFNCKKSFQLSDSEIQALGRLAMVRSNSRRPNKLNADCIVFTVVSEPVEDPLGLNNCEDIGTARLYFGDLIAYSAGSDTYTDVIPVRAIEPDHDVSGVLAVRVDGLELVRVSAKQQGLKIR